MDNLTSYLLHLHMCCLLYPSHYSQGNMGNIYYTVCNVVYVPLQIAFISKVICTMMHDQLGMSIFFSSLSCL